MCELDFREHFEKISKPQLEHLNIIFVKDPKNDVFVFGKKGKSKD